MAEFISITSLREKRRRMTVEEKIPFIFPKPGSPVGEMLYVTKRIKDGTFEVIEFPRPVREMITTDEGRREVMQKVVLDVEFGREQVPLLYQPIYERLEDRNFPEYFEAKWALTGLVIFTEHMEGEEVKFGRLQAEQGPIARIVTYSAGFEYTEDLVEFNKTFEIALLNRAFGEAYNALLNHIHLAPIIEANYTGANVTNAKYVKADGTRGTGANDSHPLLSIRETLKQALIDSKKAKRPGSVLLVNSSAEDAVREAMGRLNANGTDFPPLGGIETVIVYDGWETTVGRKTYTYPGVPDNVAFLIRPRRGFKELVKHDLLIDASGADLSRLVEQQIVGRARRGVFAAITENVQRVNLPTGW